MDGAEKLLQEKSLQIGLGEPCVTAIKSGGALILDFDIEWAENAFGIDKLPVEGKKDIHGDFGRFCYQGFRHSLCHGWASGVSAYMTEYILGVRSVEGAPRKYVVSPKLYGLQYVRGKYPTPYGEISVYAEMQADGTVKMDVRCPETIQVIKT